MINRATHESIVEKLLVRACKEKGIKCIKGKIGDKGFVDRIIFQTFTHKIIYAEIKNETYYMRTPTQIEWAKRISNSGGIYILIDGVDEMRRFIKLEIKGE